MIDGKSSYEQFTKINNDNFDDFALKLFHFQSQKNEIYKSYLNYIHFDPQKVNVITDIPFLPIDFFKQFVVKTGEWKEKVVFESSGTTGQHASKHYLPDFAFYTDVSTWIFNSFYGNVEDYTFLALLPSYLERKTSSLVHMVDHFITKSHSDFSGFYLNEYSQLKEMLEKLKNAGERVVLIGVTFALLDFCTKFPVDFPELTVIETGGMKGRGKEMVREEVHSTLKKGFSVEKVHSEYGMTELLSQAYAKSDGRFECPPWMRVMIREINDPFRWEKPGKSGGMNIIDLANIHSCAFLETKDIGIKYEGNNAVFEVLGRFDNSEIRGCNLLVT